MQEWLEPCLPSSAQVKGIMQLQFYDITHEPNAAGPVKAAIHSRCFSDSDEVEPCHLLLALPLGRPHYVPSRLIFHGDADTDIGAEEYFLKMKEQIYAMAGRASWGDDVLEKWEKDFEWLDKVQRREAHEYNGYWPEGTSERNRRLLAENVRRFYGIKDDQNDLPLVPDVDGDIAKANEDRRFKELAELEEQLQVTLPAVSRVFHIFGVMSSRLCHPQTIQVVEVT